MSAAGVRAAGGVAAQWLAGRRGGVVDGGVGGSTGPVVPAAVCGGGCGDRGVGWGCRGGVGSAGGADPAVGGCVGASALMGVVGYASSGSCCVIQSRVIDTGVPRTCEGVCE